MTVVLPQIPSGLDPQINSILSSMRSAVAQLQDETVNNSKSTADSIPVIASSDEAIAGTDDSKMVTPLKLRNGLNASGSAPIYACRAWVNFNGTGTVAIRASGNVSSITDNGTGDYTINFTTAMDDANYIIIGTATQAYYANADCGCVAGSRAGGLSTRTVSSVRIDTTNTATTTGNAVDMLIVDCAIFR